MYNVRVTKKEQTTLSQVMNNNLHYKSVSKLLKEIMLIDNYNDIHVTDEMRCNQYYIEVPNGEVVTISSSGTAPSYNYPIAIDYYSADRSKKGHLSIKHKISGQFIFALVRNLNAREEINEVEEIFVREFGTWARHWNRQYAKYFHTNEDILSV